MRYLYILFLLLFTPLFAQKNSAIQVSYTKFSNGVPLENQDPIIVYTDAKQTLITTKASIAGTAKMPYEQSIFDYRSKLYYQISKLSPSKQITTIDSSNFAKQSFTIKNEFKNILGFKCQKAVTTINSNSIEVWFTKHGNHLAAPSYLGLNLGLVLEVTRNGNYTIAATSVKNIKNIPDSHLVQIGTQNPVDMLTYRDLLWKNQFTTVPVFTNERINFSDDLKANDSVLRYSKGTVILRKIRLPEIKSGSQIFIDVTSMSSGDAYDRTGSVFIVPTSRDKSFLNGFNNGLSELPIYKTNGKKYQGIMATNDYLPTVELMRFFTPFGVKHYNHISLKNKTWQDSAFYRQEITNLHKLLSNTEVWIGANISNYDKGGHLLTANITIHPEESGKVQPNYALPLFNTNNILEMSGQEYATMFADERGLNVTFTIDKTIKNATLRYITTGHGGWENGDEFVQKSNTILLNGVQKLSFIPWRTDCGSYRSYNPASGNFSNGLSSSDYSRSNWCPGMSTSPIDIPLGDLPPGQHTIQVKIPQGKPEGNSFSSWNVSGVLLGNIE